MIMEEIYLLTKHANFTPNYAENLPVYKRRYYLELLKNELEETKKMHEKAAKQTRQKVKPIKKR